MRAAIRFACYGIIAAGLSSALPFEAIDTQQSGASNPIGSRSYDVVNVDGSSNMDGLANIDAANQVQDLQRRAPSKSYSVVNVDGSPPPGSATDETTQLPTATQTVISTQVYTEDTTIVVTETQHPAPSITQTVVYTTTILAAPVTATATATITSTPSVSVSVVTMPPSVITVTASQTDTTSYYDDGMWHTSYAVKTFTTVTPA